MATDYQYARAKLDCGRWDIDNPNRATKLAVDIKVGLPDKAFHVHCADTNCTVTFELPLSDVHETTLDGIVADHKANAP